MVITYLLVKEVTNKHNILRVQFGKLGQMIASHQRLKEHSRFLFIPGPDDVGVLINHLHLSFKLLYQLSKKMLSFSLASPGPSTVLPRCPLPKYLTEELQKYVPNAIFSSNPCRYPLFGAN